MAGRAPTDADLTTYASGACSLAELARALGVTRAEARATLATEGIEVRPPGRPAGRSALTDVLTRDFLRREVVARRRTVTEIAVQVGCTTKTVRRYLRLYGVDAPKARRRRPAPQHARPVETGAQTTDGSGRRGAGRPAGSEHPSRPGGTGLTRAALWDAYVVRAASTTQIAEAAGCAPSTVARDLRRNGIPIRRRGGAPPPDVRRGARRAGIRRAVLSADR